MSQNKTNENSKMNKPKMAIAYILGAIVLILGIFFIFPMLTNAGAGYSQSSNAASQVASSPASVGLQSLTLSETSKTITIKVQIPCGGHTSLIENEVKKLTGVTGVLATAWNKFQITFDQAKITQEQIVAAEIFKAYPATLVN